MLVPQPGWALRVTLCRPCSQAGFGERAAGREGAETGPAEVFAARAGQQHRAAHAAAAAPGSAHGQWGAHTRLSFNEPIQSCDVMVVSCESLLQELQDLKQEKQQLQQKCEQQEQALQEMGLHLSQSVPSHFSSPLLKQMHRFVSRGSCVAVVFI